jgi:ABC-2 type transport system permease protein
MKVLAALILQALRRVRRLLIASCILLAGFQIVLILQANSIQAKDSFAQMGDLIPDFVRDVMGSAFAAFLTYRGIVCLGYFHPAVMGALIGVSITLATVPVMEIENGFIDLVLARPLGRYWIVTRSVAIALISTLLLLAAMSAGTGLGLKAFGASEQDVEWPSMRLIGWIVLNLGLLMLCWSAIAMAIGCAVRRLGTAGAIAGLLALTAFLIDYVGRAWKPLQTVAWLSPFRYYAPFDLVMGDPVAWRDYVVLACVAVAGYGLAYFFYSRRDISN